jgi:hypothetical protein
MLSVPSDIVNIMDVNVRDHALNHGERTATFMEIVACVVIVMKYKQSVG